jgi:Right handed beta helix region
MKSIAVRQQITKRSVMLLILKAILILVFFSSSAFATVFLDGSTTNCNDGSTNYNPASRSCGSGSDKVYKNLDTFSQNITTGTANYIRSGSYFRDNPTGGSLNLTASHSGTPGNHTVISAYPGEERQASIGTASRGATYNSNPGDTGWTGSADYYPNSAILITETNYVTINGLKTYGQVYSRGNHDVLLQNSDFGGGGPSENQGNVVKLNNVYNAIVKNNIIHHSCWGENNENGSAIIFYDASATIEYNTFYDNWGYDVFLKDSGKQSGRTTVIKNNFFGPSNIFSNVGGIRGHNQDVQIAGQYIHHNIFLNKDAGIIVLASPEINDVYNNTFINCSIDIASSSSGGPYQLRAFNNLFYHATSNKYFMQLYDTNYIMASDYNIFFGSGMWGKSAPGATTWETTLTGWQSFISKDINSITSNPNFFNAAGSTPDAFKRTSYVEYFEASTFSKRAGAYETGNEVIGHTSTGATNVTPYVLIPPSSLKITTM